jgi:hypothetical protein
MVRASICVVLLLFAGGELAHGQSRARAAKRHGTIRATVAVSEVVSFVEAKAKSSAKWGHYLPRLKRGQRALQKTRRESEWAPFHRGGLSMMIVKHKSARSQMFASSKNNVHAIWFSDRKWLATKSPHSLWRVELPNLLSGGLVAYVDVRTKAVVWVEILIEG